MNMKRKISNQYYITVEGETEKIYLDKLKMLINDSGINSKKVKFKVKVEKSPKKAIKKITSLDSNRIYHVIDVEKPDQEGTEVFHKIIDELESANKYKKNTKYELLYTNISFELWIILHKSSCNGCKNNQSQYLTELNRSFHMNFESLDEYKKEKNFEQLMNNITLDDVKLAIIRAEKLMNDLEMCTTKKVYKKYKYYSENPSLNIHELIKMILNETGIL